MMHGLLLAIAEIYNSLKLNFLAWPGGMLIELLKKFPKAKDAGYSQVLLKSGGISSFHRLFVCPFTRVLLSSDGSDYTRVQNYVDRVLKLDTSTKSKNPD